jgi:hypothetical protein
MTRLGYHVLTGLGMLAVALLAQSRLPVSFIRPGKMSEGGRSRQSRISHPHRCGGISCPSLRAADA